MSIRKIAITGIRKAAESLGHKAVKKAYRGVVRTVNAADKVGAAVGKGVARASDATANLVRKAAKAESAVSNAVFGPVGKATRDASAAVIKATRSARPRARENMGQIMKRKGWSAGPSYTPSQLDAHVKDRDMDTAKKLFKQHGFGKVWNKPNRGNRGMNINFRDEGARGGDYMSNVRPPRGSKPSVTNMREINAPKDIGDYQKYYKSPAIDRSKLSYEEIKPTARSGPRYTNKQVKAGAKVFLGASGGYAASQYFKDKKSSR